MKHKCPCCDCLTLERRCVYEICPVCFWEDEGEPDLEECSGPNHMTLGEGRRNYKEFAACHKELIAHCRPPLLEERTNEGGQSFRG